jgi:hypothetical protein
MRFNFKTKKNPICSSNSSDPNISKPTNRGDFLSLIPQNAKGIEIGPFASPLLNGATIKYLDVLPTEILKARAITLGLDPTKVPDISYVSNFDSFPEITERFDFVISSHSIEHQPDLCSHLNQVSEILVLDGKYFLIIPDKRYCFDHFIAESTIADVLGAHFEKRRVHSAKSVIEHRALTTHNYPVAHHLGNHGDISSGQHVRIQSAMDEFWNSDGSYIDVHAWQFTPENFTKIINDLYQLDLIDFTISNVWDTPLNDFEFMVILQKR